jgi:signal transduction histidine kinase/DNA-binding NarL/FixJ family response regulator
LLFDRKSGKVKERLSEANGLSNNSVLNILEDNSGNLWLSTFFGISRFDKKKKTFQNYYKSDGLSSNEFSYNSALRLKTGEMVFGGVEGFTMFHPDSLANSKLPFTIPYLASIEIDHQPLDSTGCSSSRENGINRIKLPFDKTAISISISSIDFSRSGERRFLYYLEGWDKKWTAAQSSTIINYSRLDEGTYKLHAISYNNIGKRGPDTIILEITVLPPWYRTLWAYLVYASIVTFSIYAYNAYRVRQAELKYEAKLSVQTAQNEKEINERKLKFFTEVSHEFRTPLTLIINPLRAYLKRHSNTAQIEDLQRVHTNAQRLLGLVDQLLLFRRVGANSDDLRIAKLPFEVICRDVFNSFIDQAKIKQLKYKLRIKKGPIELYADREKVEIIIYNLLSNAVKFTPIGGEVTMCVTDEDDVIRMGFSDTGPGIPKNVGDKLFEQFYQVPETKSASGNGFGIGLYLVKHFVDRHRALISYESYIGRGSTFHLSFQKGFQHLSGYTLHNDIIPLAADPVPVTKSIPEKTTLDKMLNKQKSILIVEDNHELLVFLTSILHEDYNVYKSTSGNEALELTRQYMPDIIITDIMMENGNGLELCRKVKNDQLLGHIPVILLTAVTDGEVRLTGVESGADDYITKPFQSDLLLARVRILLENRSKLQDYFYNEITLKKHDFNIPSEYAQFLDKCITVINTYLSDEDFNIKKLSSEIGMSHSALYRKVKVISGESIAGFIRFIRLRKAAELMINTDYPVNEIAFLVGMSDQKYFRTKFNGLFGMNPSDYIKKYRPLSASRTRKR